MSAFEPPVVPPPPPPAQRHSRLGIASFALAFLGALIFCGALVFIVVIAYDVGMELQLNPAAIDPNDPRISSFFLTALVALCGPLLNLVGAGLGVAAMFEREVKKVFGILGLIFNLLMLCGASVLFILGLLA